MCFCIEVDLKTCFWPRRKHHFLKNMHFVHSPPSRPLGTTTTTTTTNHNNNNNNNATTPTTPTTTSTTTPTTTTTTTATTTNSNNGLEQGSRPGSARVQRAEKPQARRWQEEASRRAHIK